MAHGGDRARELELLEVTIVIAHASNLQLHDSYFSVYFSSFPEFYYFVPGFQTSTWQKVVNKSAEMGGQLQLIS